MFRRLAVEVSFNHGADIRTGKAENVSFVGADGEAVGASKVEYDPADLTKIIITPEKELAGNTEYKLDLSKGDGLGWHGCASGYVYERRGDGNRPGTGGAGNYRRCFGDSGRFTKLCNRHKGR